MDLFQHRRYHTARTDTIYRYVESGQFIGKIFGKGNNGCLGGRINTLYRRVLDSDRGYDIDGFPLLVLNYARDNQSEFNCILLLY